MRGLAGVCVAAMVAMGAQSAGAVELCSDNFDAEPVPAANWVANYGSFANFFVGSEGTVDLLGPGNPFGLTGDGNFVDLDGSSGQGSFIETIDQFDFEAGQIITLSVDVSGNQRSGVDNLFGGFRFFGPAPSYTNVMLTGFSAFQEPIVPSRQLLGVDPFVFSTDPYQTYSISFRSTSSGSFSALVGTGSADNIGPLIDNVSIS